MNYSQESKNILGAVITDLKALRLRGGQITFELGNISVPVDNLDVIGGVLQCWLHDYLLSKHGIRLYANPHTQEFPDFYVREENEGMLELKCFDSTKNPNFDLANFDKYLRSLREPGNKDIEADFLVLGYKIDENGRISIEEVYLKKIWEMTGPSPTNVLNIQVKQNRPVNIRPKDFRGPRTEIFESENAFLAALDRANVKFNNQEPGSWLKAHKRARGLA